jgi:hypothetical protein
MTSGTDGGGVNLRGIIFVKCSLFLSGEQWAKVNKNRKINKKYDCF